MARVLVQSTNIPGLVGGRKNGLSRGSVNVKRAVRMMASVHASGSRIRSFSGLRGFNSLDNMLRTRQDFHSKVAITISSRRRKATRCVPRAMFERFTEKAIKVIMLAQEEARRLGHNFVGTEQILLGLIGEGTGIAAKVLKSMGINLKDARVEVEKIIGRGSGFVAVEIPFTPRAKRVLELSLEEARQLGNISFPSPTWGKKKKKKKNKKKRIKKKGTKQNSKIINSLCIVTNFNFLSIFFFYYACLYVLFSFNLNFTLKGSFVVRTNLRLSWEFESRSWVQVRVVVVCWN